MKLGENNHFYREFKKKSQRYYQFHGFLKDSFCQILVFDHVNNPQRNILRERVHRDEGEFVH
jgi:hypothetical protein